MFVNKTTHLDFIQSSKLVLNPSKRIFKNLILLSFLSIFSSPLFSFYNSNNADWSLASTPVLESSTTNKDGNNSTSITITRPGTSTSGHLLLAVISTDGNETVSAPSGWTTLEQGASTDNAATLAVFYKIDSGSESADYTFSWTNGQHNLGSIMRYSGVNTSTPISITSGIIATGNSNNPTSPSVTTSENNTMIVYAYAADADYGNNATFNPSGTTAIYGDRSANNGANGASIGVAEIEQATAGATGTGVFDMRLTTVEQWRAITIAIAPTGGPAVDTDGDGITDDIDLDDDNDGIVDADECLGFGPELVLNGDFEDAWAYWTSDFNRGSNNNAATSGGCGSQGWVAVSNCATKNGLCDPYFDYNGGTFDGSTLITDTYGSGANTVATTNCNQTVNSCFDEVLADHTTGTGFSVYVDPSDIPGKGYWKHTVSVSAGKTYQFSAWIMVIEEDPNLQFKIDGTALTAGINLDRLTGGTDGTDEWQNVAEVWSSGSTSGTVVIELVNLTTGCGGNDIRIDDISLREVITICDTDGDGTEDRVDLDSDNDGIPDIIEAGGTDTDGDGRVDYPTANDPTSIVDLDNDGLADTYDETDTAGGTSGWVAGNKMPNPDTDGDGILDIFDLDVDNDGIPDIIEAGGTDINGDGLADNTTDSDSDGYYDIYDPRNEVTSGSNEGTPMFSTGANSGDGTPTSMCSNCDSDNDGFSDHLDLDADNDGIPDIIEAGGTDTNGDGKVDNITDSDTDGYVDMYDPVNAENPGVDEGTAHFITGADSGNGTPISMCTDCDTDGDGKSDHLDLDADNDGIPDIIEIGGTDTNGDGRVDVTTDSDNDGYADIYDPTNETNSGVNEGTAHILTGADSGDGTPNSICSDCDTDGDGKSDHLDLDADNDGIPDIIEIGGTDTNGDGRVDVTTDSDNDGYADTYDPTNEINSGVNEGTAHVVTGADSGDGTPNSMCSDCDTDGDGFSNHIDLDADNDGLPDIVEAGGIDTNGDGRVDATTDSDNDGYVDIADPTNETNSGVNEGTAYFVTGADSGNGTPSTPCSSCDTDNDDLPDYIDLDADNDGIPDLVEVDGIDINGDGQVDTNTDADNDGLADIYDENATDGPGTGGTNGVSLTETNSLGNIISGDSPTDSLDMDGDNIPDHLDLDADNDGIPDLIESGGNDATGNGRVDTGIAPWDVDGDGLADLYDTDNNIVAGTGDGGSALIITEADSDSDGKRRTTGEDMISGGGGSWPINPDGDALANHLDLDADNDGITDVVENASGAVTADHSSGTLDGIVGDNPMVTDSDNDGWHDPSTTTTTDSDGDNLADYLDIDADNDGIVDFLEGTCSTCPTFISPSGNDTNGNGVLDMYESLTAGNANGGTNIGTTPNVDDDSSNSTPDYLDTDSDSDGAKDWTEGYDSNDNGRADDDLMTIATNYETTTGDGFYLNATDTDSDGIPDWLDNMPSTFGYNEANRPPFLDESSSFWHDVDNDGLVDLFDTSEGGTNAPTPDNNGGNDRDWRDMTAIIALPVKLISFVGNIKDCDVQLKWATAFEENFDYFEIQWSGDGVDFSKISIEKSNGNISGSDYHFLDRVPSQINYYRLKMVDLDGSFEFSKVIFVELDCESLEDEMTIFPNPISKDQIFNIEFFTEKPNQQLIIIDLQGKVVQRINIDADIGMNNLQLDISNLSSGIYHIQLVGNRLAKKLIIQE